MTAGFWTSRGRHPSLTSNGGLHATTAGGDQLGWQCVGGWLFVAVAEAAAGAGGVDGWHYAAMHGRKEVARLAYAPRCDAGGDWFWAVRYGANGYAASGEATLAALTRSWREQPPTLPPSPAPR